MEWNHTGELWCIEKSFHNSTSYSPIQSKKAYFHWNRCIWIWYFRDSISGIWRSLSPLHFLFSKTNTSRNELWYTRSRTASYLWLNEALALPFERCSPSGHYSLRSCINLTQFTMTAELNRHQAHWSAELAKYNYVMKHQPGKTNPADVSSRRVDYQANEWGHWAYKAIFWHWQHQVYLLT